TVSPSTPTPARRSFTSSSLNGLMIASIRFIGSPSRIALRQARSPAMGAGRATSMPFQPRVECPTTRSWPRPRPQKAFAIGTPEGARHSDAQRVGVAALELSSDWLLGLFVDADQTHADRVQRERDPVANLELVEDVVEMRLDGDLTDGQASRD